MLALFLLAGLLGLSNSQPKCTTGSFPPVLPLLYNQSLPLDLNSYFQGPNLTLTLSTSDPSVTLSPKYFISSISYNLGAVLSISTTPLLLTVLLPSLRCWPALPQESTCSTTHQPPTPPP